MQFFTHPVVHEQMHRKWHGREFKEWKCWKPILTFCCGLDFVFTLILFAAFSLLKKTIHKGNLTASLIVIHFAKVGKGGGFWAI